ncbi:MAG: hypothetical protein US60_C0017G0006 [Microgenomates group bacterium GW2011_GWC1_37_8]|uniref:Glycosyltransferase RgtA/B/C/D-like domain-containing protein n=1 Tax=Candidatus Woesebacteria bacterium GW2011_GWB1_38_8 TaxID=1618570 RepID=A0A0G0NJY3_9BACT|nr:MAG: hypothetical protein US60_C0017G0006 [Microgenomates group bacterium GW2011_GWC1_37_8]KKQ86199.1 MAG: hypothetical protein UT08_C0001G0065 [Candidatus Woesebacteria bacterium GW2011_GWB1_38_8]
MINKITLIIIILLALVLRFWRLDTYPALNADEAAIGYNAYSLIQTGLDEHGNSWPIHFQSFNDYKPGLYFYLVLPLVKILGLNAWAVRIPGAILGVATVYIVYLLVKELLKDRFMQIKELINAEMMASIASLMLAISPWHIHYSRGGWEVNVATFFITYGVYMFIKILKKPDYSSFVLCTLSFALSLYAYHAARVVVPLLSLGLLVIYWREIRKQIKNFLFIGLVGLFLLIPLMKDLTRSEISSRSVGVGLFADTGPLARINEQRGQHSNYLGLSTKLLHNKVVNYGLAFADNWAEHYQGEFLFLSGDVIQRNKVPETGQMYLFDILFIVVGFIFIIKTFSQYTKPYSLILWWLFIAPTAAALTFQSPHALRAQIMVIPLTIISALGLEKMFRLIRDTRYAIRIASYVLLITIVLWNFARYEHMYWLHMAKEYPYSSQYGIEELVTYIKQEQNKYSKVIVTARYDQPYILFLYYMKYPPAKFQKEHVLTPRDQFGFSTVNNFDEYHFQAINWDVDQRANPNSLLIGTPEEIPDASNIVKEIYGSNGYKYFQIVAN